MNEAILKKGLRLRVGLYAFVGSVTFLLMVLAYFVIEIAQATFWPIVFITFLIIVALVVALLAVVYRAQIWPDDPVREAERALRRAVKRQMRSLKAAMHKISHSNAKVPVNVFVALSPSEKATCLTELGYTTIGQAVTAGGTEVTLWGAQTAVALRISVAAGQDASSILIGTLGKALVRLRPAIPANALYIEADLAELSALDGANSDRVSVINLLLHSFAETIEVSPPVHFLLRGLEQNEDLVRAAILTETLGEDRILGGFIAQDDAGQIDGLTDLFAGIIARLERLQTDALQKQLAPEFCAALVNAPFQMRAIGIQSQAVLRALLRPLPPRKSALPLHSVAFLGTSADEASADLLTRFYSQKYFKKNEMTLLPAPPEGSVSVRHGGALAAAYRRESFAIAPNRRQIWRQDMRGWATSIVLLGIVGVFFVASIINLRSYLLVNHDMASRFETYFSAMAKTGQGADALPTQIISLYQVRQGLDGYDPLPVGSIPRWLPRGSLQSFYQDAYEAELTGSFQNALVDYLERDLFAYNELSDGVTLFALALFEAEFFSDQAKNAPGLITYFTRSFADEGEVSAQFSRAANSLLEELFMLNRPPAERNTELNRVVAQTLTGLNSAELMYELILREPQFAQRVDLRSRLGPRFSEVFEAPSNPSVYLIQRAFTREGFNAMYRDGEFSALRDMIGNYDQLIGQMEASAVDTLLRRISDLYTADYIGHWSAFLEALELNNASDWNQAQVLMTALVNTTENPVQRLVSTLQNEVVISFPPPLPPANESTPTDPTVLSRYEALRNSPQAIASRRISDAFSEYRMTQELDGKQLTQFDILLIYARDVATWLDVAARAGVGTGKFLFDQYNRTDGMTPLAVLDNFAQRSKLPIVQSFGISLSETLDNAAMNFVQSYVDNEWQRRVYDPYQHLLSSMFPFNSGSSSEIALSDFAAIFGPEGAIQTFKTQFLTRFESQPNMYETRPTFLPQNSIGLAPETEMLLTHAREISDAMFVDGKPFANFRLRVSYLAPTLSEMNLSSGVTIHRFAHGPMAWTDQSWPQVGMTDSILQLRVYLRSRPVLESRFLGAWSWFRLAGFGTSSVNPSQGIAETTLNINGNLMSLQFDVATSSTPFAPNFFSRVRLPVRLFEEYEIDPTQ